MYLTRLMFTAVHNIHKYNAELLVVWRSRSFCTSLSWLQLACNMGLSCYNESRLLLSPLHHLEMMVEQEFPLSGDQTWRCYSVASSSTGDVASFVPAPPVNLWWEKSLYRSCTGSYFWWNRIWDFGWQLSQFL